MQFSSWTAAFTPAKVPVTLGQYCSGVSAVGHMLLCHVLHFEASAVVY